LEEAVAAGVGIHEVFLTPDDQASTRLCLRVGLEATQVAPDVMKGISDNVSPRGPIAVISIPEAPTPRAVDSIVLWDIGDPGNAGTIIRTAGAFGFQVIATKRCVDLWSPKVIRSGVGGHFRATPLEGLAPDPQALIDMGLRPLAAVAHADYEPAEKVMSGSTPIALLVGNEAHGVPGDVADSPGVESISLPMPGGAESLNAAVAAGILMYLRMSS
jgi:TrmH family RNA methyltransferase